MNYVMFTEWVLFMDSMRLAAVFLKIMALEMHHSVFSWKCLAGHGRHQETETKEQRRRTMAGDVPPPQG